MHQQANQSFEFANGSGKYHINIATTKSPHGDTPFSYTQPLQENLMDTSFQENVAEDHANAIWNWSILYLRNSVKINIDQTKGFNDQRLFQSQMNLKDSMTERVDIIQVISKNSILNNTQKVHFIWGLKQGKDLKNLLERCCQKFSQEVFEELILIFYEGWEKYLLFKQTTKISAQLSKLLAPSFTSINVDQIQIKPQSNLYIRTSENQIISKADQVAGQIAGCYFISTKLRYINLKQAETITKKSNSIRSQFLNFIQIIVRAVYLCSQGCFFHPNGQNHTNYPTLLFSSNLSFSDKSLEEEFKKDGSAKKRIKQ